MSGADFDPDEFHFLSQMILCSLYDRGGEANTAEIKKDTGIDNGSRIAYRIEDAPGNGDDITDALVRHSGKEQVGSNEVNVYRLTGFGETWVADNRAELDEARLDGQPGDEQMAALKDEFQKLRSRIEDLNDDTNTNQKRLNRYMNDLDRVEGRVDSFDQRVQTMPTQQDMDDVEARLDAIEETVEDLQATVDDLDEQNELFEEEMSDVKDRVNHVERIADEAWAMAVWLTRFWPNDQIPTPTEIEQKRGEIWKHLPEKVRDWKRIVD